MLLLLLLAAAAGTALLTRQRLRRIDGICPALERWLQLLWNQVGCFNDVVENSLTDL